MTDISPSKKQRGQRPRRAARRSAKKNPVVPVHYQPSTGGPRTYDDQRAQVLGSYGVANVGSSTDQMYIRQCLWPDGETVMDIPDDRTVMCSVAKDVINIDTTGDTQGRFLVVARPSLIANTDITYGNTFPPVDNNWYGTGTLFYKGLAAGTVNAGFVSDNIGTHRLYPDVTQAGLTFWPQPVIIGNTVNAYFATFSNDTTRWKFTLTIMGASTGAAISLPTAVDLIDSANSNTPLTGSDPVGFYMAFSALETATALPLYCNFRLQSAQPMPNIYNHTVSSRSSLLAPDIDSFRVPSQSMWVEYQGSTLNNQGNITTARVPAAFEPSVLGTNSYYATIAALPFYTYEGVVKNGSYAWALGDDITYYEFRTPRDPNFHQPFLICAGTIGAGSGQKMRARVVTIVSLQSRSKGRNYQPSPVSMNMALVRSYLAHQRSSFENKSHQETIRKIIGGAQRFLNSALGKQIVSAGTRLASAALSSI